MTGLRGGGTGTRELIGGTPSGRLRTGSSQHPPLTMLRVSRARRPEPGAWTRARRGVGPLSFIQPTTTARRSRHRADAFPSEWGTDKQGGPFEQQTKNIASRRWTAIEREQPAAPPQTVPPASSVSTSV